MCDVSGLLLPASVSFLGFEFVFITCFSELSDAFFLDLNLRKCRNLISKVSTFEFWFWFAMSVVRMYCFRTFEVVLKTMLSLEARRIRFFACSCKLCCISKQSG